MRKTIALLFLPVIACSTSTHPGAGFDARDVAADQADSGMVPGSEVGANPLPDGEAGDGASVLPTTDAAPTAGADGAFDVGKMDVPTADVALAGSTDGTLADASDGSIASPGSDGPSGPDARPDGPVADAPLGSDAAADTRSGICSSNSLICDAGCFARDDPRTCGSCSNDCTKLPNISLKGLTCAAGKCVYECAFPYGDCFNEGQGCSFNLAQYNFCGSCNTFCTGATATCAPTSDFQGYACSDGCPAWAPTECSYACANTATEVRNCGACGKTCPNNFDHGAGACVNGTCTILCDPGYDVCNGNCANFQSDDHNCGGCGSSFACDSVHTCRAGTCACKNACDGTCVDFQSDSSNCGACGHGCLGAACVDGWCDPITLASGEGDYGPVAVDETNVYWGNLPDGTLRKQPTAGGPTEIAGSGVFGPFALAIDSQNAYFTTRSPGGSVKRVSLAGGGTSTTLASGGDYMGVAVYGGFVYWTKPVDDTRGGGVYEWPTDGSTPDAGVGTLVSAQYNPYRLTVTSTGIFFLKYAGGYDTVMMIPLSGGTPVTLAKLANNLSDGWAIAADTTNVYWTMLRSGLVLEVSQSGGAMVTLASGQSGGYALAVDDTDVYFGAYRGSIRRVPKAGGDVTVLVNSLQGDVQDIAVDSRAVYWSNGGAKAVMKVAK